MPVSTVMDSLLAPANTSAHKASKMPVELPGSVEVAVRKSEPMSGTAHSVAKTARPRQKIAPAPSVQRRNDSPPSQLTKPPVRAKPAKPGKSPNSSNPVMSQPNGLPPADASGSASGVASDPTSAPISPTKSINYVKPPVRPTSKDAFSARKAMLLADASDKVACFIALTEGHCRKNQVGKIVFDISGMEFPKDATVKQLESYFYGKSYRRACIKAGADQYDFTKFEPWVVTHKFNPKFLFCTITMKTFPRTVENIEQHTRGAKYLRGLKIKEEEIEERKRIAEKRRRNKVKERTAMQEAKKMEKNEYMIKVKNYNSESDDDFNPNAPDDDEKEEMKADIEMEINEDDALDITEELGIDHGKEARKVEKKVKKKIKAEKMDTTDYKVGGANDGMTSMQLDNDVVDVDALPWIASKRAPAPERRSKTKAEASVAKEAAQLGSDDSSGDEDFAPTSAHLEVDDDASDDGGDGRIEADEESDDACEGPLENAIANGAADEDDSESEHKDDWGIHKKYNKDVYVGPPKPEPVVPVKKTEPANFAHMRAQIRAKKRTKQALKKAMAQSARERQVILQAKEELRAEAERKKKRGNGNMDTSTDGGNENSFWTRGKHNVELEEVRSKVDFGVGDDEMMKDEEWKNIRNANMSGSKRKRNAKAPRKSRQDRLRRVMGGDGTNGAVNGNNNINLSISAGGSTK